MNRLRKGDEVLIIAGRDKGSRRKLLVVDPESDRVIVEGYNEVKRHTKPTATAPQGGIVTKSVPMHASNVMLIDPETKDPVRVSFRWLGKDGEHFSDVGAAKASFGDEVPEAGISKVRVMRPTKRGV